MSNILFLAHRLPYPPNKGDKVRSYHLLKHLAAKHRVFLGTFIDDPEDEGYIDKLRPLCADMHVARLSPKFAKLRSLKALASDEPLTLAYFRDRAISAWVEQICTQQQIDAAVIFCSPMAQYVEAMPRLPTLIDFVDVDSEKWTQYAASHRWPMSWLYRREGERLLDYERQIAVKARRSFFVTENETALFSKLAPECAVHVEPMGNGVDAEYFSPSHDLPSPYRAEELPVVFTGAMDYWPNIDAVAWFAAEVFPELLKKWPQARFYVVGRSPTPAVLTLASENIIVTGTVPDVRPYLRHAATVVAPLRVARGIQNKILEAMAMARPVIASESCAGPVDAVAGSEFLIADDAASFVTAIDKLLQAPEQATAMGAAGRQKVLDRYSWDAHMSVIDRYLEAERPVEVNAALAPAQ